jgi:hypothetical protein
MYGHAPVVLQLKEENHMTLCPIAIVAGCEKCPAFKVCPLKSVIGDYKEPEAPEAGKSANANPPGSDTKPH